MVDVAISQLPQADYMGLTDFIPFVQGGVTKRVSRAQMEMAKSGNNSDIRSLAMNPAYPNTVLSVKNNELLLTSNEATGAGLAVESTNGGGGVLHFYATDYYGAAPIAGRLLGGIGPRPWDGSSYTAHSTTAIHFMSTETITSTGHGSVTKILATANGKTQDQRLCAATFNGYGDVVIGSYTQNESLSKGRGLGIIRTDTAGGRQVAGIDLVGNLAGYANQIQSWAVGPTGTYEVPIRAVAGQALGIGFGGYDSSVFTNARALITLRVHPASDWGPTNTPTQIVFSTTAGGSTARTDRWMVEADGKFVPVADNTYSVGDAVRRCSTIYAGTGTISTSDARLKSPVFSLNEAELKVSKLLLKEIGMYRFLSAVDEKEGSSREHCGMTVQRAIELFESVGLNPFNYAFICYDEWDEETVTESVDDGDDATPVKTKVIPAGSCYSFRETGLMMFMMAGLNARLEALEL